MPSRLLTVVSCLLLTMLGSPAVGQVQEAASAEIAPNGTLRVAFQTASPILAKRAADGSVSGVAVDLGRFIADKLGVTFKPVAYANQEAYAQSFGKGEWDVVIGVRNSLADPTPDFMVADAMYIAAPGREFANVAMVDSARVRIGVSRGGGSDQFLSKALKLAQVVRVPGGVANAVEALRAGTVDVWAANPVTLHEIEEVLPGSKVVPGAWSTGRYAASLPKGKSVAAHGKLAEIVNEATRSGVVQRSIERAGFKGVRAAPE